MIPTFIMATALFFVILEIVPNGPVEVYLQNELSKLQMSGEAGNIGVDTGTSPAAAMTDEEVVNRLKEYFGLDKALHIRYLNWLGVWPREFNQRLIKLEPGQKEQKYRLAYQDSILISIKNSSVSITRENNKIVDDWNWKFQYPSDNAEIQQFLNNNKGILSENNFTIDAYGSEILALNDSDFLFNQSHVNKNITLLPFNKKRFNPNNDVVIKKVIAKNSVQKLDLDPKEFFKVNISMEEDEISYIAIQLLKPLNNSINELKFTLSNIDIKKTYPDIKIFKSQFKGLITGDLGKSYKYKASVGSLIGDRVHISLYFGFVSFLISHLICIPLGIFKAIKHGSKFDFISSIVVFIGYAVPGFLLGALLLIYTGGGSYYDIFPLGEFRSDHWEYLTFWQKINDQLHHSTLPMIAWMVGSFATLTVLMKNSLLENLSQDYVRTAFAKGLSERRVIFMHAVRNSLIPIATGIGHLIGIWLAGSYILEKIFNIDGIGMLSYNAIIDRDYPIVIGFMTIALIIKLLGNLLSDICYALIDPRIRFK
tara:strand:+ start:3170 stop:4783 length:1614 start_codon:yes stop_codon:yes gene_type:complete